MSAPDADELAALLGGPVEIVGRLLGGASRQTWAIRCGGRDLVLRRDPPGAPRSGAMAREAALLRAAGAAGVPVPEVVAAGEDWIVMSRVEGEALARRILRDDRFSVARDRLTGQCAAALAALHRGVPTAAVAGLPEPLDPLADLRALLDAFGQPRPALELGLLRLERSRPAAVARTVVHGDFRLGNLLVDETGLAAVLDWELAHVGDPAEDLGWMCVRSWRFGGAAPVAGIGTRQALLAAYAEAGGVAVDEATLRWWEGYGTLRWGIICIQQAYAHLSGAVRSMELAAIGRRTCEVELDLLDIVAPGPPPSPPQAPAGAVQPADGGLHGRPTAGELVEAVREWIATLPLTGPEAFGARVAGRALQIVERELASEPAGNAAHASRLAGLGVADDADLAAQIRAGRDDEDTVAAVRADVVARLAVADPALLAR